MTEVNTKIGQIQDICEYLSTQQDAMAESEYSMLVAVADPSGRLMTFTSGTPEDIATILEVVIVKERENYLERQKEIEGNR